MVKNTGSHWEKLELNPGPLTSATSALATTTRQSSALSHSSMYTAQVVLYASVAHQAATMYVVS